MRRDPVDDRRAGWAPGIRGIRGRRLARVGALAVLLPLLAATGARGPDEAGASMRTHRVRAGDTLWSLARRYGVRVDDLIRWNGIQDVRRVPVGLELRIRAEGRPSEDPGRTAIGAGAPPRAATREISTGEGDSALAPLVEAAERALRTARFEEAWAAAERGRASLTSGRGTPALRARLELAAATAEVALGRTGDAIASCRRALDADPALRLESARQSPKVIRVCERARREPSGRAPGPPGSGGGGGR